MKTIYVNDNDRGAQWKTYRAYWMQICAVAVQGIAGHYPSDKWVRTQHTFRGRTQQEAQRKAERLFCRAEIGGFVEVREESAQ